MPAPEVKVTDLVASSVEAVAVADVVLSVGFLIKAILLKSFDVLNSVRCHLLLLC